METHAVGRLWAWISFGCVLVGSLLFFHWYQFSTDNLYGCDGYYHIKYSYFMRTEGWHRTLPWL